MSSSGQSRTAHQGDLKIIHSSTVLAATCTSPNVTIGLGFVGLLLENVASLLAVSTEIEKGMAHQLNGNISDMLEMEVERLLPLPWSLCEEIARAQTAPKFVQLRDLSTISQPLSAYVLTKGAPPFRISNRLP